jgi:polyphosphate kinase
LLTADTSYTQDVLAFFNASTEHAQPSAYRHLITAPHNMRMQLIAMIHQEAQNTRKGLPCGIVMKVNALDDEALIEALYSASQAGVPMQLIVRGICCLVPQDPILSAHVTVRSIVGRFL